MSETGALAQISQARRFLEQAKDLTDIKAVKDMAEAARLFARAKHLGFETENAAAEIKVRADRKLGEVLATTKKQKPGDYRKRSSRTTVPIAPSLADLGISKDESSNAQAIAELPDDIFEHVITETKEAGKRLATKPVVSLGRKRKQEQAATAMRRGRAEPRPSAEQSSPVNAQNLLDAQLRKSFAGWLVGVANICAVDPARVVEVLALPAAEHAEAARLYACAKHLGFETENAAAEIKVRAERKLGETLAARKKHPPGPAPKIATPGVAISEPPTLGELGITDNESSNAQAVAALPDDVFEQVISETKDAGKPLATKPLVREGRKRKQEQAATSMRRGRAEPRPSAQQSSPVNAQNLLDAQLRKSFAGWLVGVANICAVMRHS